MTTYVGGQSVLQQTVVADGVRHPVSEPECSGSQTSEWSLSGQRLLTRADITCIGQPARTVSAVTLMAAGPTWVDIQAVGTGQDAPVRVRHYRRTDSLPQNVVLPADLQGRLGATAARLAGPTVMTLEEVVEASGKVAAPAVAAALYETGSRFDLNGRTLKATRRRPRAGRRGRRDGRAVVPRSRRDRSSIPRIVEADAESHGGLGPPVDETPLVLLRAVLPAFCVRSVLRLPPVPSALLLLLAVRLLKLVGRSLSTLLLPRPASRHYSPWRVSADQVAATGTGATSCRGVATHGGDLLLRTLRARAVRPRPTTRHDRRAARSREAATRAAGPRSGGGSSAGGGSRSGGSTRPSGSGTRSGRTAQPRR